jgi:hypothetical protein
MGQRKVNWLGIIIGSLVGAAAISNLASAAESQQRVLAPRSSGAQNRSRADRLRI